MVLNFAPRRRSGTKATSTAGFTLAELLVVVAIMALVSSLIFANNSRFGGNVLLQNLAYDMALSIRQAQVYGISVARFQTVFAPAYGMRFNVNTPTSYIFFADTGIQNGLYDGAGEFIQDYTIRQGFRVASICVVTANGGACNPVTTLDVTFRRPEPGAFIRSLEYPNPNVTARITVSSPRGYTREIMADVNGQIAVL